MIDKTRDRFFIRVNYKSGHSEEFWVYQFEINKNSVKWESVKPTEVKPVLIGYDEIESVWQIKAIEGTGL